MESNEEQNIVIDDPEGIRSFRATNMWMDDHDFYDARTDKQAALDMFDANHSEKDLEPVLFDMSNFYSLLPDKKYSDDAWFSGEVMEVYEKFTSFFDVDVWRIDVKVASDLEGGIVLPFYLTDRQFSGEWRPKKGEFVNGTAWLQGIVHDLEEPIVASRDLGES